MSEQGEEAPAESFVTAKLRADVARQQMRLAKDQLKRARKRFKEARREARRARKLAAVARRAWKKARRGGAAREDAEVKSLVATATSDGVATGAKHGRTGRGAAAAEEAFNRRAAPKAKVVQKVKSVQKARAAQLPQAVELPKVAQGPKAAGRSRAAHSVRPTAGRNRTKPTQRAGKPRRTTRRLKAS